MKHTIFILFLIHTLSFQTIYSAAQPSPSEFLPKKTSNAHLRSKIQQLNQALAEAKSEKSTLAYALHQTRSDHAKTETEYAVTQRENSVFQSKIFALTRELHQTQEALEKTRIELAAARDEIRKQDTILSKTAKDLKRNHAYLRHLAGKITTETLPEDLTDTLHAKIFHPITSPEQIAEITYEITALLTDALVQTDLERRKAESRGALLIERPLQPRTAPVIISQYLRTGTIAQHPSGGGSIVRAAAKTPLS